MNNQNKIKTKAKRIPETALIRHTPMGKVEIVLDGKTIAITSPPLALASVGESIRQLRRNVGSKIEAHVKRACSMRFSSADGIFTLTGNKTPGELKFEAVKIIGFGCGWREVPGKLKITYRNWCWLVAKDAEFQANIIAAAHAWEWAHIQNLNGWSKHDPKASIYLLQRRDKIEAEHKCNPDVLRDALLAFIDASMGVCLKIKLPPEESPQNAKSPDPEIIAALRLSLRAMVLEYFDGDNPF